MQTTLTVRISSIEAQKLDGICGSAGKSCSEVVRESLRQSQAQFAPLARRAGWLTEEDILQDTALN